MKNKFELIVDEKKEIITSLKLLDGINYLRELEYKNKQASNLLTQSQINKGRFVELQHKTLLEIIRDEFEDGKHWQNILPTTYKEIYKLCKNKGEKLERIFNINIGELSYENK